jgi:hypothetical protein
VDVLIRDQTLKLEAILTSAVAATLSEGLDGEFTLSLTVPADAPQAEFLTPNRVAEVEDNLFDVVRCRHQRGAGLTVDALCEHVSYRLLADKVTWFTFDGTASAALAAALSGTAFTVGDVETPGVKTISIQEATNRRAILAEIARIWQGEFEWDRFTVHLRVRRGREHGPQLRVAKNLLGLTREVDARTDGEPRLAYEVEVADLAALPEYGELERVELGDVVRVIDPELGIDEEARVIRWSRDVLVEMTSRFTISNRIHDLADPLVRIERVTVAKDEMYNGIRIGPVHGFEAVRSDLRARAVMNATEGIRLQKGDGTGVSWEDRIYFDVNGEALFRGQTEDGHTKVVATGVQVFDALDKLRVHLGQFAAGRFGLRIIGANQETALDEWGVNPDFVKRFPNKILNSGFEYYKPGAAPTERYPGTPLFWEGAGVCTTWANWEGDISLELGAGGYVEQGMFNAENHAGADPAWWQSVQTRVSFRQKGAAVRVWVKRVSDGVAYTLIDNSGETPVSGTYLDYGAAPNWEDGFRTFYLQPSPGDGRVKLCFQNMGATEVWLDATQMEPDFTGLWPSFYTPGPRNAPSHIVLSPNDPPVGQGSDHG